MNEMSDSERVAAFRSAVPFPSPARLAAGRERLLAAATTAGAGSAGARHRARPGPFPRWRPVIALSAAVAVAVGTGYALTAHAGQADRAAPSATPATPSASSATATQAVLAAQVLNNAANVVSGNTVTEPSAGQWILKEGTDVVSTHPAPMPNPPEWTRFDGGQTAYYEGAHGTGPLVVHTNRTKFPPPGMNPWKALETYSISPKIAWDVLNSLPASPRAVLAVVAAQTAAEDRQKVAGRDPGCSGLFPAGPGASSAEREFDCLSALVWNAQTGLGGPPAGDAAAFRAMATLPGISVQQGITDATGAPAIGVSDDGGLDQMLLSSATYQVIGLRWTVTSSRTPGRQALRGPGNRNPAPNPPKGPFVISSAFTFKLVAGPGDR